jgi:hypothetical protein
MAEKVIHSPSPPYVGGLGFSKPIPGGKPIFMAMKIN